MKVAASTGRADFSFMARTDWLFMLAFTFPVQFVQLFQAKLSVPSLINFLIQLTLTFAFIVLMGVAVDAFRGRYAPASIAPDRKTFELLQASLNEQQLHPPCLKLNRLRIVPSDYSMGAHVRGVLWPFVVISGGMLVGLFKRHPDANAIMSHEISHIQHGDRFLPGLIGCVLFQIVGTSFQIANDDWTGVGAWEVVLFGLAIFVYQVLVFGTMVSCFSHYREYYADANALNISSAPGHYIALLESAATRSTERFAFFHPSLARRVVQARNGFPVLRRTLFWKIYLFLAGGVSLFQYLVLDTGFIVQYALANFILSLVCLGFECCRTLLLKRRADAPERPGGRRVSKEKWTSKSLTPTAPPRPILPTLFLWTGCVIVIALSNYLTEGSAAVISVGGAIVYCIYRFLKTHDAER